MTNLPYETFLEAPGPLGPLKGTLLSSSPNPENIILIVPGSGPTDREGNNPLGVNAGTYRLLAEGLAKKGRAVLRIDKRGMFGSLSAVMDANSVVLKDYVDDIRSWLNILNRRFNTKCIWLLGHSEGGIVTLASAQENQISGIILVATPSRPLSEVLRHQFKTNLEDATLQTLGGKVIDALEQGQYIDVENMPPVLQSIFNPSVQGFLIDLFTYNPSQMIEAVTKPILILQGERDIQVDKNNAGELAAANPGATVVMFPDTNHVLKPVTSDNRQENIAAYTDPSLPLAPGIVDAISQFLSKNAGNISPE